MKWHIRALETSIFAIVITFVCVGILFSSDDNSSFAGYWTYIIGITVLLSVLFFRKFPRKLSLSGALLGMLLGIIFIKLGSLLIVIMGVLVYAISLFLFAFKRA